MWGYKSHHALVKGVFHPKDSDIIILFVTKQRQPGSTQFKNELRGNIIKIEGADKHGTDQLLQKNMENPTDQIYLFYRENHTLPFTFLGKVHLIQSWIHTEASSEFEFFIENFESIEDDMALLDYIVHYDENTSISLDVICQSAKQLTYHLKCERDIGNREHVIQIQGTNCFICGFNYAHTYGEDIAKDFIDIHYIGNNNPEEELDFSKDFIPICANCHRMLHRKRNHNIDLDTLKKRVTYYQKEPDYEQLSFHFT
jgi:5-methylcytosine-specific restriction protein A